MTDTNAVFGPLEHEITFLINITSWLPREAGVDFIRNLGPKFPRQDTRKRIVDKGRVHTLPLA
jgi:hypothetical protein